MPRDLREFVPSFRFTVVRQFFFFFYAIRFKIRLSSRAIAATINSDFLVPGPVYSGGGRPALPAKAVTVPHSFSILLLLHDVDILILRALHEVLFQKLQI